MPQPCLPSLPLAPALPGLPSQLCGSAMMLERTADPHPGALAPEPGPKHLLLASWACGSGAGPSCCSHRKGGSSKHASSGVPSWEPTRKEGGFVFLLPSLPFGSASGGKTQPLLHPSPADRDERGGLMQSSWAALPLRPAPLTRPPTHRNRSGRGRQLPARAGLRGTAGTGERVLLQPRASSRSPSPLPAPLGPPRCCQRMGIPWDLQHPALPTAGGDGVPQLWLLPWLSRPQVKAVCLLWSCLCPLCLLEKHWGETRGIIAAHPTLAAAGEGASALSPPGRSQGWWDPAS